MQSYGSLSGYLNSGLPRGRLNPGASPFVPAGYDVANGTYPGGLTDRTRIVEHAAPSLSKYCDYVGRAIEIGTPGAPSTRLSGTAMFSIGDPYVLNVTPPTYTDAQANTTPGPLPALSGVVADPVYEINELNCLLKYASDMVRRLTRNVLNEYVHDMLFYALSMYSGSSPKVTKWGPLLYASPIWVANNVTFKLYSTESKRIGAAPSEIYLQQERSSTTLRMTGVGREMANVLPYWDVPSGTRVGFEYLAVGANPFSIDPRIVHSIVPRVFKNVGRISSQTNLISWNTGMVMHADPYNSGSVGMFLGTSRQVTCSIGLALCGLDHARNLAYRESEEARKQVTGTMRIYTLNGQWSSIYFKSCVRPNYAKIDTLNSTKIDAAHLHLRIDEGALNDTFRELHDGVSAHLFMPINGDAAFMTEALCNGTSHIDENSETRIPMDFTTFAHLAAALRRGVASNYRATFPVGGRRPVNQHALGAVIRQGGVPVLQAKHRGDPAASESSDDEVEERPGAKAPVEVEAEVEVDVEDSDEDN